MKHDLFSDINSASDAEFDVIEIWKEKLFKAIAEKSLHDISVELIKNALDPYSINSLEQATFSDNFADKFEKFEMLYVIAEQLRVKVIVVIPGFVKEEFSEKEIKKETLRALREFSKLAKQYYVKIGFEFLGEKDCSISRFSLARDIIQELNESNVGLVIDTYHFFKGGSKLRELEDMKPENIFLVHVSNLDEVEVAADHDRLMPGDGKLPIKEFFAVLRKIGYDGVVSVELFNGKYWEMDPKRIARESYEKLSDVLNI